MSEERPVLSPIPGGMRARVDHAGVHWQIRAPAESWLVGVGLSAVLGGGVGAGLLALGLPLWLSWLPLLLVVPVILQLMRATRIDVSDRAVTVERRSGLSRERTRLELDVLRVKLVEPHETTSSDALLILEAEDEQRVIGRGQPRAHLAWLGEAIEVAQEAYGARERAEGREWTFLRKAPDELQRLRTDEQ